MLATMEVALVGPMPGSCISRLQRSSCRAISDLPRNMTDDMIRAVGKNGGVIGINFGGGFLNPKDAESLYRALPPAVKLMIVTRASGFVSPPPPGR